MTLIEIPYPPMPFLKIEFSDIVVLIAFSIFGFKSALIVAVVKTLGDLLFQGAVGPMGIGQVTALIASLSYVFLVKILKVNIKEDGIKSILFKFLIILISISLIMTVANYLFITPIYHGELFWFQMENGGLLGADKGYLLAVIVTYIPFNLLKGTLNLMVYYLVAPRILDVIEKQKKA